MLSEIFPSPGWTNPAPSAFHHRSNASTPPVTVPDFWICFSISKSLFILGVGRGHKIGCNILDVVSWMIMYDGIITSLDLFLNGIQKFLFISPRIWLTLFGARTHYWLMLFLLSMNLHWSFSSELLLSLIQPSLYCCQWFFLPRYRTWHLLLWNFMGFLLVHSSCLSMSLCMAALFSTISDVPSILMWSENLRRLHLVISLR